MTETTAVTAPVQNTGWNGLWTTLYQRVILSYKSTLLGMAVLAASIVTDQLVQSPNKAIAVVGSVIAALLALYKSPKLNAPAA